MASSTIERVRDISIRGGIIVIGMLLLYPIYKLVFASMLFSYIVYPSKRYIKRIVKSNTLATMVTTVIWLGIIIYFIIFLINMALGAVTELYGLVQTQAFKNLYENVVAVVKGNTVGNIIIEQIDIKVLLNFIGSYLSRLLAIAPNWIIQIIGVVIFSFYMLRDGPDFIEHSLKQLGADNRKKLKAFLKKVDNIFRNIIFGYIASAIIIGGLVASTLLVLGVPQAFLLGVAATLFSAVPMLGPFIPSLIAAVYLIYNGLYFKAGLLAIIWIILTFTDDLIRVFVSRKYMDKNYKLHPLLFILGLLAGPSLFGPIGLVLGPMIFGAMTVAIDSLKIK